MSPATTRPRRVLIADDHAFLRDSMGTAVERIEGFLLAGTTANSDETVAAAAEDRCDIVLLDLHMPGLEPTIVIRKLTELSPRVAVVAMSLDESTRLVQSALSAGAAAFLFKRHADEDLEPVLRVAARALEGGWAQ